MFSPVCWKEEAGKNNEHKLISALILESFDRADSNQVMEILSSPLSFIGLFPWNSLNYIKAFFQFDSVLCCAKVIILIKLSILDILSHNRLEFEIKKNKQKKPRTDCHLSPRD